MAKQLDKSAYKNKIVEQETNDQMEDLAHLQEKKKRLGRSDLYKRGSDEPQSST